MHIFSDALIGHFPNRILNLHPALPGTFPGTDAIRRAFEAFGCGEITGTGVMVHTVLDEGVDVGPVIAQVEVPIPSGDTLETLEARIHECARHRPLVETLQAL